MKYLNFIEKVNNICVPREAFSLDLATHNIPTGRQTACFYSMARRFREAGNFDALRIVNIHGLSAERIGCKIIDVLYTTEKAKYITNNKLLDRVMSGVNTGVYKVTIDKKNIFSSIMVYIITDILELW